MEERIVSDHLRGFSDILGLYLQNIIEQMTAKLVKRF